MTIKLSLLYGTANRKAFGHKWEQSSTADVFYPVKANPIVSGKHSDRPCECTPDTYFL